MKRFLCATLVATMVLSSCGGSEPATTEGGDTGSTTTEGDAASGLPFTDSNIVYTGEYGQVVAEPTDVKIYWKGDQSVSPKEDNYMFQKIEADTGIHFVPTASPNAESRTDINLFATQQFPTDIMFSMHDYDLMENYALQGAFINLADYLDIMPNLNHYLTETEAGQKTYEQMANENGELFLIPGYADPGVAHVPFVRTDWLEKVGMDIPQTTEEFEAMLYAFKDANLGANGVTVPFVAKDWVLKQNMPVLWGSQAYSRANGKMVLTYDKETMYHGWTTPEFRNAVTNMSRWYDDGIINKECFTEEDPLSLYFPADQGGATYNTQTKISLNDEPNMPEGFNLEAILIPEYEGVRLDVRQNHIFTRSRVGISAATENVELACATLDLMFTEEYVLDAQFGPEEYRTDLGVINGKHVYQQNEAFQKVADEQYGGDTAKAAEQLGFGLGPVNTAILDEQYLWYALAVDESYEASPVDAIEKMYAEAYQTDYSQYEEGQILYMPNPVIQFTTEEASEVAEINTALDTYLDEFFAKAITGNYTTLDDAWWDAYIKDIESLGVRRLEEIYNTAYNR